MTSRLLQFVSFATALVVVTATEAPAAPPASPVARKAPAQQTLYTCPMHSQIRWTRPGPCPECGMKMVAVKAAPAAGQNRSLAAPAVGGRSSQNHAGMDMGEGDTSAMGGMSGGMGCGACMEMMGMGGMGGTSQGAAPAARKMTGGYGRSGGGGGGRSCGC